MNYRSNESAGFSERNKDFVDASFLMMAPMLVVGAVMIAWKYTVGSDNPPMIAELARFYIKYGTWGWIVFILTLPVFLTGFVRLMSPPPLWVAEHPPIFSDFESYRPYVDGLIADAKRRMLRLVIVCLFGVTLVLGFVALNKIFHFYP